MQSSKLGKYTVYFENGEEYHRIKREVWGSNCYYIELQEQNPTILDLGAHIGLTTLYFKKLYPESRVIAVEPVSANIALLKKNIWENQLDNIEVFEGVVGETAGEETIHIDNTEKWYSTAGVVLGGWTGDQETESLVVKSQSLSYFLGKYHPDLVKMDIEGAEERVLVSARDNLTICPEYLIEFHPIEGRGMDKIVELLINLGYTVQVEKDGKSVDWYRAKGLSLIHASQ